MGNPAATSSMLSNVGTGLNAAAGVTAATGIGVPLAIGLAAAGMVTSIISGILNNQETDKVNAQNLALHNQERADILNQNRITNDLNERTFGIGQQKFQFEKQQQGYMNAVNKEKTGFDRQQIAYDNAVKMLSNQTSLTQNRTNPFIKR